MSSKNESLPQEIFLTGKSKKTPSKLENPSLITSKVNPLLKSGKLNEALNLLTEISKSSSNDIEIIVKLGHLCFKIHDYNEAEKWYIKALNSDSVEFLSQIWFGLGQIYYIQKYYPKSISAFINVLNIEPEFAYSSLCYLKIGYGYYFLRDYQQAVSYVEKSLERGDLNKLLTADGVCLLGCVQIGIGDIQKAFSFFDHSASLCKSFRTSICLSWKLIETDPQKSILLLNKLSESGKPEEVIEYHFFKSVAYIKLQKWKKSLKILEHICRIVPNNYIYSLYLAIALFHLSNYEGSLRILTQILKVWQYKVDLLLPAYVFAGKTNRQPEAMDFYIKAYGILIIHGYSVTDISNIFMNAINTGIAEPKFSLLDCPLSKCTEFTSENLSLT